MQVVFSIIGGKETNLSVNILPMIATARTHSHNSLNADNSVGRKRTQALFEKSRLILVRWLPFVCEWGGGGR